MGKEERVDSDFGCQRIGNYEVSEMPLCYFLNLHEQFEIETIINDGKVVGFNNKKH